MTSFSRLHGMSALSHDLESVSISLHILVLMLMCSFVY